MTFVLEHSGSDMEAARRAGLSDGFYRYPRDPGNLTGDLRRAYNQGWDDGDAAHWRQARTVHNLAEWKD